MRMRLSGLALGLLAMAALAGLYSFDRGSGREAEATGTAAPAEQTGDVIVKFKTGTSLGDVGTALDAADTAAIDSTGPSGLVLLEPEAGQTVDGAVADLEADPRVEFAEPDVVVHLALTPTDPLYATYQWHMGSTAAGSIGLPTAWNTTTGNASIIVAVIDTGVDGAHPDLSGKITTGANAGFNFVSNNTNTADDHMHGTFAASIIAANTNNGQGGAGVCWSCKIMPIKVLDNTGSGSSFNVSQGIDWAVSHGAKIVNLSLGGGAASSLQTSVDNAWNANVVVIAASGNDNGPVLYPGAYSNAIAVGSNNSAGARSSFSNFGPELDIMAPGETVLGALCTCGVHSGGYGHGERYVVRGAARRRGGRAARGLGRDGQAADPRPHAEHGDGHGDGRVRQPDGMGPGERRGSTGGGRARPRRRRRGRTRRDADAHEHAYCDADADEHATATATRDQYANGTPRDEYAYGDANTHEHADGDGDAYQHADGDGHAHEHADGDAHAHADEHAHEHGDRNTDAAARSR